MKIKHIVLLSVCFLIIYCMFADDNQDVLSLISTSKAGVGYGIYVDEGYAYITNNDGVIIFDVQRPGHPRKVAKILTGVTFGICVENGLAYILGNGGLVIADVKDPSNPKMLGEHACIGETHRIRVERTFAYIASAEGLEIMNISDPSRILPVSQYSSSGGAWGIDLGDGVAYLASPSSGLELIDVTDPVSPWKITAVAGTKGAWDVHRYKDVLYVGCHGSGIKIISLFDKELPRLIGSFRDDDSGEALGVQGFGEYLYTADNFCIEVLDVSDPTCPQEIGEYSNVRGAHDIFVDGNYVYVAEAKKGLMIFEVEQERRR